MSQPLKIWTNTGLPSDALELLRRGVGRHRLVFAGQMSPSILAAPGHDEQLALADVAFGQPDAQQVIVSPRMKWIHLTTAGYTRYDTPEFRAAMKSRQGILTNSSSVFSEPCAEHLLAMILSIARQLPVALENQRRDASWKITGIRAHSQLLENQSALIYGAGAIGRRLIELLTPLRMKLTAVRRNVRGDESVRTVTTADADGMLASFDHVINILPASVETELFFDARRFTAMKRGAIFYNIGRGTTVDQTALLASLESHHLGAAYLDVTTPEPLPSAHPLWKLPNCFITPHTAGGHADESKRIVQHFLENLLRFDAGKTLEDVVR